MKINCLFSKLKWNELMQFLSHKLFLHRDIENESLHLVFILVLSMSVKTKTDMGEEESLIISVGR